MATGTAIAGNQRRPKILEENEHDDRHEDKGFDQCLYYLVNGDIQELVGGKDHVHVKHPAENFWRHVAMVLSHSLIMACALEPAAWNTRT